MEGLPGPGSGCQKPGNGPDVPTVYGDVLLKKPESVNIIILMPSRKSLKAKEILALIMLNR